MFCFRHGISDEMMNELARLAEHDCWWRDVLNDVSLIIAMRDEYLNVYSCGQALFTIKFSGGSLRVTTHPKYLFNPDLKKQINLNADGKFFDMDRIEMVTREYRGKETLNRMVRASRPYADREKIGVQAIVARNTSVVDVEIALSDGENVPRIDMGCIDKVDAGCRLTFWEAKRYGHRSLRPSSIKLIADQINKYKEALAQCHKQVVESYQLVARNLLKIHEMSKGVRPIADAVRQVAEDSNALIFDPSDVGLVIFEYDDAQRSVIKAELEPQLKELGINRIRYVGDPKQIRL